MKCEICHNADAKKAIKRESGKGEEELYVCEACAKAERLKRQKKSHRTHKIIGLPPGVEMSITEIHGNGEDGDNDGEVPTPIIGALVGAFHDLVSDLDTAVRAKLDANKKEEPDKKAEVEDQYVELPASRIDSKYRLRDRFHLEGLYLIGELDAVKRALRALQIELDGIEVDGIRDAGHVYKFSYGCSVTTAKRVASDLIREEQNARTRLLTEMTRTFGDTVCRSLAILKNCRLLAPGEIFDILSPVRLAALEGLLEGVDLNDIERDLNDVDLNGAEETMSPIERESVDAERADEYNRRFEDVMLNETAEGMFL